MSVFSAIAGGMHGRKELRVGQRQQMAEAFAKYKANNPLATVADFQNFIDSFSGGNNYVAGGAPGEAVLKRIEASNRARESERKRTKALDELERKQRFIRENSPLINQAILGSKTVGLHNEPDLEGAYSSFLAQNPLWEKSGIDIRSMFSPSNYNQLKSDLIQKNAKNAYDYIEMADDPKNVNVEQFARIYTGGNTAFAKELLDSQSAKYDKNRQILVNQEKQKVTDFYKKLAADPNVNPDDIRSQVLSEFSESPYVSELWPDMLDVNGTTVYTKQPWEDKYITEAKENREKTLNKDRSTALSTLNSTLTNESIRATIYSQIMQKGPVKAREYFMNTYGAEIPDDLFEGTEGKKMLDDWFDGKLSALTGEITSSQEASRTQAIKTNKGKGSEAVRAALEANIAKAQSVWSDSKMGASLSGGNPAMPTVSSDLAKMFEFNDTTTRTLMSWVQANEEAIKSMDATTLYNEAATFLNSVNATPWSDRAAQIKEIAASVIPLQGQTFQQYKTSLKDEIAKASDDVMEDIDVIGETIDSTSSREELLSAVRKLQNLKTKVKAESNKIDIVVQNERDTKTEWLNPEGGLWVDSEVDAIKKSFNTTAHISSMDNIITEWERQIDLLPEKTTINDEERNKPDFVPDPEKLTFQNVIAEAAKTKDFDLQYDTLMVSKGFEMPLPFNATSGSMLPIGPMTKIPGPVDNWLSKFWRSFTETQTEYDQRGIMQNILRDNSIKEHFRDNKAKWDAFKQSDNPIEFIKNDPKLSSDVRKLGIELGE